jgi:hypothetical protein
MSKSNLITEANDRIRVSNIDVEMDRHLRIVNKASGKHLAVTNGVISEEMSAQGYIATICARLGGDPTIGFAGTQDLHVTREQLESLRGSISAFLERNN